MSIVPAPSAIARRPRPVVPGTSGRWVSVLAAVACALAAAPASAKLGDGIKVGPGRLKLGVDIDARFDNNAGVGFPDPVTKVAVPAASAFVLRARPSFALDIPGESWTAKASGGVDWNQYLSSQALVGSLSYLGAQAGGQVNVAPKGGFGGDVSVNFNRSDRISNPAIAVGALNNSGDVRGRLRLRPGGGDSGSALEFGGWYGLGFELFAPQASGLVPSAACGGIECDTNAISGFSSLTNRVGLDAKWRPFPKTGVTLELDGGFRNYPYFSTNPVPTNDAVPLRALVGFGTLLTTKFFFLVKAGYGGLVFLSAVPSEHTLIGQLEGGLRFVESVEARLGVLRSIEPTAGNLLFFATNRGYFDFRGKWGKLSASAGVSVDLVGFGGATSPTTARSDFILAGSLGFDYQVLDWMRLSGGLRANLRQSNAGTAFNFGRVDAGLGLSTLF